MKAELERISNKPTDSFQVKIVEREQRLDFKAAYHYHPEYELIWTIKGAGRRFIGNHIAEYKKNELIFLGKNIPHCWMTPQASEQMVVQMKEDFLGLDFLNTPECFPLRNMLKESYRGLQFHGKTKKRIQAKMKDLLVEKSFRRLLLLLEILNELAQSDEFEYLSTEDYRSTFNPKEFERIHTLYNYIHENYQGDINIDRAVELSNLTKSAFCKFVKRRTKKTFSQIVNEVRLGKAAELLRETEIPITQICYDVGYNDPSYFFRQFSKIMGVSPKQFRSSFA